MVQFQTPQPQGGDLGGNQPDIPRDFTQGPFTYNPPSAPRPAPVFPPGVEVKGESSDIQDGRDYWTGIDQYGRTWHYNWDYRHDAWEVTGYIDRSGRSHTVYQDHHGTWFDSWKDDRGREYLDWWDRDGNWHGMYRFQGDSAWQHDKNLLPPGLEMRGFHTEEYASNSGIRHHSFFTDQYGREWAWNRQYGGGDNYLIIGYRDWDGRWHQVYQDEHGQWLESWTDRDGNKHLGVWDQNGNVVDRWTDATGTHHQEVYPPEWFGKSPIERLKDHEVLQGPDESETLNSRLLEHFDWNSDVPPLVEEPAPAPSVSPRALDPELLDATLEGPTLDRGLIERIEQNPELVDAVNQNRDIARALERDPTQLDRIARDLGVAEQGPTEPSFGAAEPAGVGEEPAPDPGPTQTPQPAPPQEPPADRSPSGEPAVLPGEASPGDPHAPEGQPPPGDDEGGIPGLGVPYRDFIPFFPMVKDPVTGEWRNAEPDEIPGVEGGDEVGVGDTSLGGGGGDNVSVGAGGTATAGASGGAVTVGDIDSGGEGRPQPAGEEGQPQPGDAAGGTVQIGKDAEGSPLSSEVSSDYLGPNIPDPAEEPAPAPPAPPGPESAVPMADVDPALLDPNAPGPTLDPNLFDPAAPGPTVDPSLLDPVAPGPTIDPALLDPAAPGPTIDPALLDPAAPGPTVDPNTLDPAAPGPTVDPSLLAPGVAEPSAVADPALADPALADPSLGQPATPGQESDDPLVP